MRTLQAVLFLVTMLIMLVHLYKHQRNQKERNKEQFNIEETVTVLRGNYIMLGYLFNMENDTPDMANDAWRLFGRNVVTIKKDGININRTRHVELYIESVNINYNFRIYLKKYHIKNYENLISIKHLPNKLEFDHPYLSKSPYAVVDVYQFEFIKNIQILNQRLQNVGKVSFPQL
uniref:Uncharacterized protein n=1 Tax=viral metagenome TaxID=1070528 RepID=A0A6C0BE25_9ZZZZ